MKRAWLALALLSTSWLFGLEYFQAPRPWCWIASILAAVWLLRGIALPAVSRLEAAVGAAAFLPAIWIAPGIYRAIPILLAGGSTLLALRPPARWLARLAPAAVMAGAVLLVQAVVMYGYESVTARWHDLPWPLPEGIAGTARLIGADATVNRSVYGPNVELYTMRRVHPIAATWELLAGPATFCFLAGGILLIALCFRGPRWKGLVALGTIVLAWVPFRVALLLGIYLHRALMTDYDAQPDLMNQFFSPWAHLAMLLGPCALAAMIGTGARADTEMGSHGNEEARPAFSPRSAIPPLLGLAGCFLAVLGIFWCPSGGVKNGRVLFDEFHSRWEPTDRPYDTQWYGPDAGYNYSCIFDYCSHFYDTRRLSTPLREGALARDDVLIIKVPTSAYSPDEIARVERFVREGGSALFIGEHTDVFGTGSHINAVTRPLGFAFRYDCAFGIRSVFEQLYEPPLLAHPIVGRMPPLDFEISATIDVGATPGRAAIRGTGLKNAFADYHASNFYPQIDDFPDSRYGSFVQMWAREYGRGRIIAFADSTQFSNFSAFEPGKPEMLRGMLQWLRRNNSGAPVLPIALAGVLLLGAAALFMLTARRNAILVLGGVMLGWACAVPAVRALNLAGLGEPAPIRPITRIAIDRTVCDATLSKGGFIGGKEDAFGIFERWILRLGWFPFRLSGDDIFDSRLIVFFHPHGDVDRDFRDKLVDYVDRGGHILILDSPENPKSTANSLLWPFKLTVKRPSVPASGSIIGARGLPLPSIPVSSALQVEGGKPVALLVSSPGADPLIVAAGNNYGKGSVTVIGFGSRFSDSNMGVTGDMEPTAPMRAVYEFEFELLRQILDVPRPATSPSTRPADR